MKLILISMIIIGSYSTSASPNLEISSIYTDFSKDCKPYASIQEGDIPQICKGPKDYTVYIFYSACLEFIQIKKKYVSLNIELPSQPIGSSDKRKLEWRLFRGEPFGIIYRVNELEDDPNGSCPKKKKQQNLEIRTLKDQIKEIKLPSDSGANDMAREILDKLK